ncbi:ABC transporter substrate-binding protein [Agromyces aerolatus]|uniref:ABC transporter substrate-binding protein n=1 Tax=Agromyces sp. LY-1074 TaxID=3074080 RepID=UPI00285BB63E|nr:MULTISPECIES: sugar ABC transporter substrate-binding protein [unclassified Agromyces]MDR5700475.1 sugar ABC transporter substrate-binding protein [Agromyces sp. LY-1074]MDR5706996.1 sugar ABC transporter substrate-binding protein [Agromyces sp. LY-1358]
MRRRTITATLATAAFAVALTGCASGGTAEADGDLSGDLLYAIWDENQAPALEQMAADFTAQHPEVSITVEVTPFAQYWTKLQTQATAKTLPDVFWMNGPNAKVYAPGGVLEPITGLIESGDVDPANYPDSLNELYTLDGVQYGVPKDFDTIGVWYNADILERAGVAIPTADWTWADFQEAAQTVSEQLSGEGVYGAVAELASGGQQGYYNTIFQAGGSVISDDMTTSGYDDPKSIEGLQFWADLIASGASPTIQQLSDTTPNQWFTSGKAAMYWAGSWMVSEIAASEVADAVGTVQMPAGERSATVIHGVANVVAADGENTEAALAFAAYLGSEEAALTLAEFGAAIPAFNGTQDAWVASAPTFGLQMFLDAAADYAVPDPESYNTGAWREVERELLPQAFSGERPVAEVAQELADRMNELLAEEQ